MLDRQILNSTSSRKISNHIFKTNIGKHNKVTISFDRAVCEVKTCAARVTPKSSKGTVGPPPCQVCKAYKEEKRCTTKRRKDYTQYKGNALDDKESSIISKVKRLGNKICACHHHSENLPPNFQIEKCAAYQSKLEPTTSVQKITIECEKPSRVNSSQRVGKLKIKTKDEERHKKRKMFKCKKGCKKKGSDKSVVLTLQLDMPQTYIDDATNTHHSPVSCKENCKTQLLLTDSTTGESSLAIQKYYQEIKGKTCTKECLTDERDQNRRSYDSTRCIKRNHTNSYSENEASKLEKPVRLDISCQDSSAYCDLKPTNLDKDNVQRYSDSTSPERCNFQFTTFVHGTPSDRTILNHDLSNLTKTSIMPPLDTQGYSRSSSPNNQKYDSQKSYYQSYRQVPERLLRQFPSSKNTETPKPINRACGLCHQSCLQANINPCIHQINPEKPLSQDQYHAEYFHRLTTIDQSFNDPLLQTLITEAPTSSSGRRRGPDIASNAKKGDKYLNKPEYSEN